MAIGFVGQLGGAGGSAGAASAIDYGIPVQDVTELRAVPPALRGDKQQRLVEDQNAEYRFDATGVGADDGDLIIVPDTGTGRWFKITPSGGIPSAHAASHAENATDEILVEDLGTAELDTTLALMVDGTGGLIFGAPSPAAHAASHTDGTDDIQDATAAQKGLATATQITKLDDLGVTHVASVTIMEPDLVVRIDVPFMPIETEQFPSGVTIVKAQIKTSVAGVYSVNFNRYDDVVDTVGTLIATVATAGGEDEKDSGVIAVNVSAGETLGVELPATDIDFVVCTFYYKAQ